MKLNKAGLCRLSPMLKRRRVTDINRSFCSACVVIALLPAYIGINLPASFSEPYDCELRHSLKE